MEVSNIFIIGSKGIPAKYGGFETFVEMLTAKQVSSKIKYHVSCISDSDNNEFEYNGARCFNVKTPNIKSASAVLYDLLSLRSSINYIKEKKLDKASIYILACRIGPFLPFFKNEIKKYNINIFLNPDGHEWKRTKWNYWIRKYWKFSEKLMVKHSDFIVCDSKAIEAYIKAEYKSFCSETMFIPYGAEINSSILSQDDMKIKDFYNKNNLNVKDYYLVVGRFVPENNLELIIKEFLSSNTEKDLVIISNVKNNSFYNQLLKNTDFNKDRRIKFVGTVYDAELLKKIRENSYAYIHGHEVGGTNPSLLEALASTDLNLLLDVSFNREVGENGVLYFNKHEGNLKDLLSRVEELNEKEIGYLKQESTNRIIKDYNWPLIIKKYEDLFINYKESPKNS